MMSLSALVFPIIKVALYCPDTIEIQMQERMILCINVFIFVFSLDTIISNDVVNSDFLNFLYFCILFITVSGMLYIRSLKIVQHDIIVVFVVSLVLTT
jgi:hypothetical protein